MSNEAWSWRCRGGEKRASVADAATAGRVCDATACLCGDPRLDDQRRPRGTGRRRHVDANQVRDALAVIPVVAPGWVACFRRVLVTPEVAEPDLRNAFR